MELSTNKIYLFLFCAVFAQPGFAEEAANSKSETKVKIEDVANRAPSNDEADEIITNRMARAQTGSLSKWSLSTSLGFSGGSIERPLDGLRPNIFDAPGQLTSQSLAGGFSGVYRITNQDRLSLTVSGRWVAPFTDTATPSGTPAKRQADLEDFRASNDNIDFFDPSFDYSRIGRVGPFQSVSSVSLVWITNQFDRNLGRVLSPSISQTFLYEVGTTGLTLGVSAGGAYKIHDVSRDKVMTRGVRSFRVGDQTDTWALGLYPFIEYVINDYLNFRTLTGFQAVQLRTQEGWNFTPNNIYQSVGIGISVTRDVFLYPNVQFLPEDIRADRTNVAISANINIF